MNVHTIIASTILALGVIGGGWTVGQSLENSRKPIRTVTVKGLAEKDVKANLGFWPVKFVAAGPTLESASASLSDAEKTVRQFLTERGVQNNEIEVQNIRVEDRFVGYNGGNYSPDARYNLQQDMLVTTANVDDLAAASREVGELIKAGVVFSSDSWSGGPSFVFTGISDLKSEMLTQATQRAKQAAQQFAEQSQSKVGNIKSANQGVFQILPAVDIPNDRPDKQIDKKVRVVSTVTYFLVD